MQRTMKPPVVRPQLAGQALLKSIDISFLINMTHWFFITIWIWLYLIEIFSWQCIYLFDIPLRCLVADYNKILFLNQINGYKGEEGGISKSSGVVKKDKQLLALNKDFSYETQ